MSPGRAGGSTRPARGAVRALLESRGLTLGLGLGLVAAAGVLASPLVAYRLPGHNEGYAPTQPVAFSHALHAGTMGIACLYCHVAAERGQSAGAPAVGVCLNCHRQVDPHPGPQDKLAKVYAAAGLGPDRKPDRTRTPAPLAWTRVHVLPRYVRFDHSRHVGAGVACAACHGPVETMDRVRQVRTLAMGMCVNCHRTVNHAGVNGRPVNASTDCVACHY